MPHFLEDFQLRHKVKKVVVHFGGNKTGSTALQQSLFLSRHKLLKKGVVYPDFSTHFPSKPNQHWPLAINFHFNPHRYYMLELNGYSQQETKKFCDEVMLTFYRQTYNADTVLLSAEAFANLNEDQLQMFLRRLGRQFDEIKAVFYARPPNFATFYSMFQEFVKGGQVPDAASVIRNNVFLQVEQSRKIERVFPDCVFRVFSREAMVGEDVVTDFLWTSNLGFLVGSANSSRSNSSLALESVALLYFCNKNMALSRQERFKVRQAVVRFDRQARQMLTAAVPPCPRWDAEIKKRLHSDWCEYLGRAGRAKDLEKWVADYSNLHENPNEDNLFGHKTSIEKWLEPYCPTRSLVSPYFDNEVMTKCAPFLKD